MDALTFLSAHVPLFVGFSEEALTPLAADSTLKKFAPGQAILHAGISVDALYVMVIGKAAVHAKIPGKGTAIVATLALGEVFGEASILENSLPGATVKAGEEGAVVLLIPEGPFRRLISESEPFAERVRTLIATRRAAPSAKAAA